MIAWKGLFSKKELEKKETEKKKLRTNDVLKEEALLGEEEVVNYCS